MDKQVALVTGASSGIGEDAARRLLEAGFEVYGVARRVERMAGLADAGAHVLAMDVTDDDSMVAGVEQVLAEQGRIDVLVNNAGYGSYGALEEVPPDEGRRQFEVNVFAAARLAQLAIPSMRAHGGGRIVNVGSIAGKLYAPLGAWYHASKFALEGLSDSLRLELAPFGIRVVLIEPGPVLSEWSDIARAGLVARSANGPYADLAAQVDRRMAAADTAGRASTPDVVGAAILEAVTTDSPAARYPVGNGAEAAVEMRRRLPDDELDRAVMSQFG